MGLLSARCRKLITTSPRAMNINGMNLKEIPTVFVLVHVQIIAQRASQICAGFAPQKVGALILSS
jgi:hypothetical protein